MGESNYVEWLVKRKEPAYGFFVKIGMLCLSMLSVVAAFTGFLGMFGIIIVILVFGATYYLFLNLNVEYEYLFADGGLSVDRILGKARRKKVLECEREEVMVVAPADSYSLKNYEKAGMKVVNCSSCRPGSRPYALIFQKGPDTTKVILEPNEKMLGAMKRSLPRKVLSQ